MNPTHIITVGEEAPTAPLLEAEQGNTEARACTKTFLARNPRKITGLTFVIGSIAFAIFQSQNYSRDKSYLFFLPTLVMGSYLLMTIIVLKQVSSEIYNYGDEVEEISELLKTSRRSENIDLLPQKIPGKPERLLMKLIFLQKDLNMQSKILPALPKSKTVGLVQAEYDEIIVTLESKINEYVSQDIDNLIAKFDQKKGEIGKKSELQMYDCFEDLFQEANETSSEIYFSPEIILEESKTKFIIFYNELISCITDNLIAKFDHNNGEIGKKSEPQMSDCFEDLFQEASETSSGIYFTSKIILEENKAKFNNFYKELAQKVEASLSSRYQLLKDQKDFFSEKDYSHECFLLHLQYDDFFTCSRYEYKDALQDQHKAREEHAALKAQFDEKRLPLPYENESLDDDPFYQDYEINFPGWVAYQQNKCCTHRCLQLTKSKVLNSLNFSTKNQPVSISPLRRKLEYQSEGIRATKKLAEIMIERKEIDWVQDASEVTHLAHGDSRGRKSMKKPILIRSGKDDPHLSEFKIDPFLMSDKDDYGDTQEQIEGQDPHHIQILNEAGEETLLRIGPAKFITQKPETLISIDNEKPIWVTTESLLSALQDPSKEIIETDGPTKALAAAKKVLKMDGQTGYFEDSDSGLLKKNTTTPDVREEMSAKKTVQFKGD